MARLTQAKYYELKANLYSLANELIKEVDIEKTKKVVDFISLIDKLQKEEDKNKSLCETCRFNNEGVCGIDAEPLENIDLEGCIFYEINQKTTKNR